MQNTVLCFSHKLNYALGWTVIHSLWQAMVIALLSGVVMIALRNKTAKTRYLLSNLALLTVLLSAVVTFCIYYDFSKEAGQRVFIPDTSVVAETSANAVLANTTPISQYQNTAEDAPLSMEGLKRYFNRHIYLIVTIWVLGVALFMLRLLSSISYVYYLKSKMNFPADEYWQELLDGLAAKVNIQKGIELVESALVRSPMVIGHLKPVILFPIGAINRLNPSEVEAILAHELAHVMRNDYAFNIIQSVIEALFYFHPAVWWISAQIRAERENCCDDVAIELCGNSMTYAKSLVSVQEMAYYSPQMAMAFAGKSGKNQLLMRVQRVLNQPQNKTNIREKLIATSLLIALMIGLAFGGNRLDRRQNDLSDISNVDSMDNSNGNSTENVDSLSENGQNTEGGNFLIFVNKKGQLDSLPIDGEVKDGKYNFSDNTQQIDLTVKNRQVIQFNINGLEVASADIPKFGKIINRIVAPPSPPSPPSPQFPELVQSPEGMYLQNGGNNLSVNENGLHLNGVDDKGNSIVMSVDKNGFVMNGNGISMNISGDETTYEEDAKPVKGLVDYHKNGKLSSVVGTDGTIQNYDEKGDLVNIIKPNGVIKDYKNRKLVGKNTIYPSTNYGRSNGEDTYEEDAKPVDGRKSYHPNGKVAGVVGTNGTIQRFNEKGELEAIIKPNGTVKRYKNKKLLTITNNQGGNNYPQSNNISRKTNDPYNTLHLKADNGFSYVNFTLNGNNIWKCYKNEALLGDLTLSNNKVYYNGQTATSEQLKQFGLLWYNSSLNPLTGGFQIVNNNISGNNNENDCNNCFEDLKEELYPFIDEIGGLKNAGVKDEKLKQLITDTRKLEQKLKLSGMNKEAIEALNKELSNLKIVFKDFKNNCNCTGNSGYSYSYGTDEQARKNAQKMAQQAQKDAAQAQRNAAQAQRDAAQAQRDAETAKRDAETARRDAESQARSNNYGTYTATGSGNNDKSNDARTSLIKNLIKDGYIQLNKKCKVAFDNDELIIDGKELDEAVFKRYKADFEKKLGKKTEYSIKFKGIVTAVRNEGVDMTGEFNISID